jgi:hypothetical protein
VALQDRNDIVLRFSGTLRCDQERLDLVAGPARNHHLHEVGRLRVERFHDPRVLQIQFIWARGKPAPLRETPPKVGYAKRATSRTPRQL